jgi:hypothetical protein
MYGGVGGLLVERDRAGDVAALVRENSWRSVPPSLSGARSYPKNTPLDTLPNRRSICTPEPPITGVVWQAAHAFSLNVGPRPSLISSVAMKLSSASANRSGSVPGSAPPIAVTLCRVSAVLGCSASAHAAIAVTAKPLVAKVRKVHR